MGSRKIFAELLIPAGMIAALIIGAGFFSLPYIFSKVGLILGFAYLAVFVVIISALHLMYAEVITNTEGEHRFLGYARIYLGKFGEYISFLTTVVGLVLALLIYIVLVQKFMSVIYPFESPYVSALIFWFAATLPVLMKVTFAADFGSLLTIGKVFIIALIFYFGFGGAIGDTAKGANLENLFLPYSAVLFSLYGRAAISSIQRYFKDNGIHRKLIARPIILGTVASGFLYALFAAGVIGLSTRGVSPDAISGLLGAPSLMFAAAVLGVISLFAAYIFLGLELREIFIEDLKFTKLASYLIVIFAPIALYFLGLNDFLELIGIAGGVFISIEAMLIVAMWNKLKKRSLLFEILSLAFVGIFLFGAVREVLGHF